MSDIKGTGFGSAHDWTKHETSGISKCTAYSCKVCGEGFIHFYDSCPDIFEAIRAAGIGEKCDRDKVVKSIVNQLMVLNEEQRMKIFNNFCKHCGRMDPCCNCWRDE